jgi:hypothetical protein
MALSSVDDNFVNLRALRLGRAFFYGVAAYLLAFPAFYAGWGRLSIAVSIGILEYFPFTKWIAFGCLCVLAGTAVAGPPLAEAAEWLIRATRR